MELVQSYLYQRVSISFENISNVSFHKLKSNGWYSDKRNNQKFTMLNKRIEIDGQWYRILIRFTYQGLSKSGDEVFQLSSPVPFLITECESKDSLYGLKKWTDTKTYHGPKLKSVSGYLEQGIPSQLIEEVYEDLQSHVTYLKN